MSTRKLILALGLACTLGTGGAFAETPGLGKPISDADIAAWNIDVLPDGTGLLELRRYRLRVRGHLDERGVVLSAQVRTDRRIDNRRHGRQRDEDDRADSDRDPGAQAHGSSRST